MRVRHLAVDARYRSCERQTCGANFVNGNLDRDFSFAAHRRQVLNVVRRDDVELIGVGFGGFLPTKAERVEELAARALHEQQEAHVVQNVERIEIVEIDALYRTKFCHVRP